MDTEIFELLKLYAISVQICGNELKSNVQKNLRRKKPMYLFSK